jgi:hypothetical protein
MSLDLSKCIPSPVILAIGEVVDTLYHSVPLCLNPLEHEDDGTGSMIKEKIHRMSDVF